MIITLGAVVLGLLIAWRVGGFLLRATGATLTVAGLLGLIVLGQAGGLLVTGIGAAIWLAGHWHYALRHQEYKSPLARNLFCRLAPRWLDPTRRWVDVGGSTRRAAPGAKVIFADIGLPPRAAAPVR